MDVLYLILNAVFMIRDFCCGMWHNIFGIDLALLKFIWTLSISAYFFILAIFIRPAYSLLRFCGFIYFPITFGIVLVSGPLGILYHLANLWDAKESDEEYNARLEKHNAILERKKLSPPPKTITRKAPLPRASSREGALQGGKEGEERVRRFLQQLSIPNMVINDKNIDNPHSCKDAQIDHFVICEKGIIMIETKNYGGEVDMTDRNQWIQTKPNGERKACMNAYYQSVMHMNIMKKLMEEHGFADIYLHAIVVFANENTIYKGLENYHGFVMKYDAMNYFIEGRKDCPAMKDPARYSEVVNWIQSFKDSPSYSTIPQAAYSH